MAIPAPKLGLYATMIKTLFTILFTALLAGCVGISTYTDTQYSDNTPEQERDRNPEKLTNRDDFLRVWGEPTERVPLDSGAEMWTYKNRGDLAWRGVLIWLLVPVPLLVPAGHGGLQLSFDRNGILKFIASGYAHDEFYGCTIGFRCRFSGPPLPAT